jgi:hypothetical protein
LGCHQSLYPNGEGFAALRDLPDSGEVLGTSRPARSWKGPTQVLEPKLSVLYCTVLYCTVLYCTVLYCTVLVDPSTGHVVPGPRRLGPSKRGSVSPPSALLLSRGAVAAGLAKLHARATPTVGVFSYGPFTRTAGSVDAYARSVRCA